MYSKYIIIQKTFRGYRLRKKLKVFKDLPRELWDRVLYYTKYQHHIQHEFKNSVSKIYDNKILVCDNNTVELRIHNLYYDIIFSLRTFTFREYYLLLKNNIMNMFRKYSLIIY